MSAILRGAARPAVLLALLAPAVLLAGGCTMCPDPFDYSGPVPNGSVTQNDFAARSNGTRPVRSTPFPWPPLVDSSRQPTPADDLDTTLLVAAESPLADGLDDAGSVVHGETAVESGDPARPETEPTASTAFVPESTAASDAASPVTVPPGVVPPQGAWMTQDRRLPPPGNVAPPAGRRPSAPARETSGWRAAARSMLGR